jgi:PAS domain S-box-containing protein
LETRRPDPTRSSEPRWPGEQPPRAADLKFQRVLDVTSAAAGLFVLIVAAAELAAWRAPSGKTALLALPSMKANMALALAAAGAALTLKTARRPWADRLAMLLGALTAALGGAVLVEWAGRLDLGIDQALVRDAAHGRLPGGRPSPGAALILVCAGVALGPFATPTLRGFCRFVGLALGALAFVAYGYDLSYADTLGVFPPVSLHGAVAVLALFVGIECVSAPTGLIGMFLGRGPGAIVARRFFPAIAVAPLLAGWLIRHFVGATDRDAAAAMAIMALATSAAFTALLAFTVRTLDASDRYRELTDASADVIIKVDADDVIEYASPSASRYGYKPRDLVGVSGFSLVHPEDEAKLRALIAELFAIGEVDPARDRTYRLRTADGGWVWMEGAPTIIKDGGGKPLAVVSQLRDVTERILADQALSNSQARYRAIAENATDIVALSRPDGARIYMSPAVRLVLGYTPEEAVAIALDQSVHPDDWDRVTAHWRAMLENDPKRARHCRFRMGHKDGSWVWVEASPTVLRDAHGAALEVVDVIRDVTAHMRLEAELVAARDAAEEGARVKAEFMANMSHEIRTPLTAILGFTGLLDARSDLSAEARHQVRRVSGAGRALLALVNDILDSSKLEAGEMSIRPRPARLGDILAEALDLFQPQAAAKGLELRLELGDLPPVVSLDQDRFRQVLVNLIGNAVKFTEAGAVTLGADYDAESERLEVRVCDSGCGMTEAAQAKLFQRFSQADESPVRKHKGTGLGLAISRVLVEAMGGEIGVSSAWGVGSTFHIRIKAPLAEEAWTEAQAGDLATEGFDIRVLVVDDNAPNRELARVFLESLGAEVTEAENGLAGVEMAEALPFDVILMDLRMPILDGLSAARRIRAGDGPNHNVPIVAFTADVGAGPGEGASVFDAILRKPMTVADLVRALSGSLGLDQTGIVEGGDQRALNDG